MVHCGISEVESFVHHVLYVVCTQVRPEFTPSIEPTNVYDAAHKIKQVTHTGSCTFLLVNVSLRSEYPGYVCSSHPLLLSVLSPESCTMSVKRGVYH